MLSAANVIINLDDDDDEPRAKTPEESAKWDCPELQITEVVSLSPTKADTKFNGIVISDDEDQSATISDPPKDPPNDQSNDTKLDTSQELTDPIASPNSDENSNVDDKLNSDSQNAMDTQASDDGDKPKLSIRPLHTLKKPPVVPPELPKPNIIPLEPLFNKGYQDVFQEFFNIPKKTDAPVKNGKSGAKKSRDASTKEVIYLKSYDDDDEDNNGDNVSEMDDEPLINFVKTKKRKRSKIKKVIEVPVEAEMDEDDLDTTPIVKKIKDFRRSVPANTSSGKPRSFTKDLVEKATKRAQKRTTKAAPVPQTYHELSPPLSDTENPTPARRTRGRRRQQNGQHGVERRFECVRCGDKFTTELTLQEHVAEVHISHSPSPPPKPKRKNKRQKASSDSDYQEDEEPERVESESSDSLEAIAFASSNKSPSVIARVQQKSAGSVSPEGELLNDPLAGGDSNDSDDYRPVKSSKSLRKARKKR